MQVPVLKHLLHFLDQLVLTSAQGASDTRNSCLIIEQVLQPLHADLHSLMLHAAMHVPVSSLSSHCRYKVSLYVHVAAWSVATSMAGMMQISCIEPLELHDHHYGAQ